MNLLFQNNNGDERIIANCTTWKEVNDTIDKFIEDANTRNVIPFVRYYTRTWEEDNRMIIDVGSHTEFFIWEK